MKNASYRHAAVLALGLVAVMSNAAAELAPASASASISNFSYQLFDLDLTDGITPSLSLVETLIDSTVYANVPPSGAYEQDGRTDFGATSILVPSGSVGTLSSAGTYAGNHTSSASVTGTDVMSGSARSLSSLAFTLSASTAVRFYLSAEVEASNVHSHSYSSAIAVFNGGIRYELPGQISRSSYFYDSVFTIDGSTQGTLFGYLETDKSTREGYLLIDTGASAHTARGIPPVPEPQTYLMMLAGVAVLAGARRPRKS